MIDLKASLEEKHVVKIVGNEEHKKDIFEKFVHSMKLLEQLNNLFANKHYVLFNKIKKTLKTQSQKYLNLQK